MHIFIFNILHSFPHPINKIIQGPVLNNNFFLSFIEHKPRQKGFLYGNLFVSNYRVPSVSIGYDLNNMMQMLGESVVPSPSYV